MLCHSEVAKAASFESSLYGGACSILETLSVLIKESEQSFVLQITRLRRSWDYANKIRMRHVAPSKKLSEVAVPLWVSKRLLSVQTGRAIRTVDNWMAAGRLAFRKFPSGMTRFRLDAAERRFGIGGLPIKSVDTWVWVDDQVNQTELAEIHDISVDTVREWVERGIVPYQRNPSDRLSFDPLEVESALSRFDVSCLCLRVADIPGGKAMIPYKETRRIILKGGQEKIDVRWRLNVSSSEVRVRKDFETQADAIKYAAAIKTVKKRAGVSAVMTIARLPDRTS